MESFFVLYSPPSGPGTDSAAGPFLTLDAATAYAESIVGETLRWE